MALIKSISGIRGTIGNRQGEDLSPVDIAKFTAAFGSLILSAKEEEIASPPLADRKMVIGRDGRVSG